MGCLLHVTLLVMSVWVVSSQHLSSAVPDDCSQLPSSSSSSSSTPGLRLSCRLGGINSASEKTNFGVVPSSLTTSLYVTCLDSSLRSHLESEMFATLHELRILELLKCRFSNIPSNVFVGLANLQTLKVSTSRSLTHLESAAFEGVRNLESLDLSSNALRSVHANVFCHLVRLRSLNVSDNELQQVDELLQVDKSRKNCLRNVRILDLSFNRLHKLELKSTQNLALFTKLETLRLDHNRIESIRVVESNAKFKHFQANRLRMVDVSHNRLRILDKKIFHNCPNLEYLDLSHNFLTSLDSALLENLSKLRVLDVSSNLLKNLDFLVSDTNNLISLDLSSNLVSSWSENALERLGALQSLNVSSNHLSELPKLRESLVHLRSLDLSNNRLRNQVDLSNLLQKLKLLSHLLLTHNTITDLKCSVVSKSLQVLDLRDNRLTHLDSDMLTTRMPKLQALSLIDNRLELNNLHQLRLSALWKLEIDGNDLNVINADTFGNLPALQLLGLANCGLTNLPKAVFRNNPVLQTVRLDGNKLERLDGVFHSLSELTSLNVSSNHLKVFDFAMVNLNVSHLDLSDNSLEQLENYFDVRLPHLVYLNAAHNALKGELSVSSMASRALKTILINDNQLESVKEFSFVDMNQLEKVDLRNNRIELLDVNALRLDDDEWEVKPQFLIAGNPFRCDCHMSWLRSVNTSVRSFFPWVSDLGSVSCQMLYSRSQSFVAVSSAHAHSFLCSYTSHCFALCHCCDYDACDCEMSCPKSCTCFHDTSWTKNVADCSKADFDIVPDDLPMDATEIFLDGNDLSKLDGHAFIGRKNLEVLYLNHSSIVSLDEQTFNGLSSLALLHLNGNSLRSLPSKVFTGLSSLRELYLQDNLLTSVASEVLVELKELQLLDLRDNKLTSLPPLESPMQLRAVLRLSDNAWHCSCHLFHFLLSHINSGILEDLASMKCTYENREAIELQTALKEHHCPTLQSTWLKQNLSNIRLSTSPADQTLMAQHHHGSLSKLLLDLLPMALGLLLLFILATIVLLLSIVYREQLRQCLYNRYKIRFFHRVIEDPSHTSLCSITFDTLIVHCTNDECVAAQLALELHQLSRSRIGLVYRDLIYPSLDVISAIKDGMDGSRHILLLLSKHFITSDLVSRKELNDCLITQIARRRDVIVVLLDINEPNVLSQVELKRVLRRDTLMLQWADSLFWPRLLSALDIHSASGEDRQWLLAHHQHAKRHEDDSESFSYQSCSHNSELANHYTVIRSLNSNNDIRRQRGGQPRGQEGRSMTIHM